MRKADKPRLHEVMSTLDSGALVRVIYEQFKENIELPVMNVRQFRTASYSDSRQYAYEVRKVNVTHEFIDADSVIPRVVFTFTCAPFTQS